MDSTDTELEVVNRESASSNLSCEQFQGIASTYINKKLSLRLSDIFEQHSLGCDSCRNLLEIAVELSIANKELRVTI